MKLIISALGNNKKIAIMAPVFKMAEAFLELFVPLIIADIVDIGLGSGDYSYCLRACAKLAILAASGLALSLSAQYFSALCATCVGKKLRSDLFDKCVGMTFTDMDSFGESSLITRMSADVNGVQSGVNLTLRLLLRSPFIVVGAYIMALIIDVKISLIFAAVIILLAIIVALIMKFNIPGYESVQRSLDMITLRSREALDGIRVIRALGKERDVVNECDSRADELKEKQLKVGYISSLMDPLTFIVVEGAVALLLVIGARFVNTGSLTPGQIVALIGYMTQILSELLKFANLIIALSKTAASIRRIKEVLNVPSKMPHKETIDKADRGVLASFENVTFSYHAGAKPVLNDVSFEVKAGEKIGIIGKTASGKSTIAKLLMGFYKPDSGSVRIAKGAEDVPVNIAMVGQNDTLFIGSIKSNILMGNAKASDEEVIKALKDAQAYDFIEDRPNGINDAVEQGASNFSGGQKQRMLIARGLIADANLLILDDVTSALDAITESKFKRALKDNNIGSALIFISQKLTALEDMDKILVLDDGMIAGFDTFENLLVTSKVFREIYNSQYKKASSVLQKGGMS